MFKVVFFYLILVCRIVEIIRLDLTATSVFLAIAGILRQEVAPEIREILNANAILVDRFLQSVMVELASARYDSLTH